MVRKQGQSLELTNQRPSLSQPSTVQEALPNEHWKNAMRDEYMALRMKGTWSLVPLSPIGYKWVFKVKVNPDGQYTSTRPY